MSKQLRELSDLAGKTIESVEENNHGLALKFTDGTYAEFISDTNEDVVLNRMKMFLVDKEKYTILRE